MRCLLVSVLLSALVCLTLSSNPQPPSYPAQYTLSGTLRLPYFNISEPFTVYLDQINGNQFISYYNGTNTILFRKDLGKQFSIGPQVNQYVCVGAPWNGAYIPFLPNLTDTEQWKFAGVNYVQGQKVNKWVNSTVNYNYTNEYAMYTVASTGAPVLLVMKGWNFLTGCHPDEYVFDYTQYIPALPDQSPFNVPSLCNVSPSTNNHFFTSNLDAFIDANRLLSRVSMLNPRNDRTVEEKFIDFQKTHKREYQNLNQSLYRFAVFKTHSDFIDLFNNQPEFTFKLAINEYSDWSSEEFMNTLLPQALEPESDLNNPSFVHPPPENADDLPQEVDWRLKGVVTPIKDQGCCGACWTFATTGAIESAWALSSGRLISLSEQQLVDCAWINTNYGCGGGYAWLGFTWVISNGGIGTESSYAYKMQNDFCHQDLSSGVTLSSFVNVTANSESALQDAVANIGPIATSIDASGLAFRFYTSGVYYSSTCSSVNLNHAVLVIGYGVDLQTSTPYWLVKNSWSVYWGDQGFIKMIRNDNNNCGIATRPVYPIV